MMRGLIKSLTELSPADEPAAGGKAASLARLLRLGLPVPQGYVVLADAFGLFLQVNKLESTYRRLIDAVAGNAADTSSLAGSLTSAVLDLPLPTQLEADLSDVGLGDVSQLAVRSSATVEDSETAAWAGQLETFLNVPRDELALAIRRSWASMWSPRAIAYAQHRRVSLAGVRVAVILQETVDASVSGVLFTADPVSGDTKQLLFEAVFGLGESLVGGAATPDTYWIDKSSLSILRHRTVAQRRQMTLDSSGGTKLADLSALERDRPKLSDEQVKQVVQLALTAETAWERPLDVEWCLDAGGRPFVLQARPITTLAAVESESGAQPPEFALSITRGWSLLFCQIWHQAYTHEFYHQFGWGLSDVLYEGANGVVRVYRAPTEFVVGMTDFVRAEVDAQSSWLEEQATTLTEDVAGTRDWLSTVQRTPLPKYSDQQLLSILDEFVDRNVKLGPRYVLALWYPIRMEHDASRDRYANAIAAAIAARVATHSIGGAADAFARRLAAEVLRRRNADTELARATPLETLRSALAGASDVHEDRLRAYARQFLVTRDGVRHEDAETYCARTGIPLHGQHDLALPADTLKGVIAYPGKARGRAALISGPHDFSRFKTGDILVTSMTTPDYEVIMSQAAGIVTDEGGATSHAAILARELRKPTVIGTQTATQLFATSDLVEVNADDALVQRVLVGHQKQRRRPRAEHPVAAPSVMVFEDNPKTRGLLVSELYRQARSELITVPEVWTAEDAWNSFRRLRSMGRVPDAIIVDLLVARDPFGGTAFAERVVAAGYPADQLFVYSAMATAASRLNKRTRTEVFSRLEDIGISRARGNVFGKVRPGEERLVDRLADESGELATISQLVAHVLHAVGVNVMASAR